MRKKIVLVGLTLFTFFSKAQTFDFNNQQEADTWYKSHTNTAANQISYNDAGQKLNYTINSSAHSQTTSNQIYAKTLSSPLNDVFTASFKVRRNKSATRAYFPMMFTNSILTGVDNHPWRENPSSSVNNGQYGNQQSNPFIAVYFTGNSIQLVSRLENQGATSSPLHGFAIPVNQDFWVRLSRLCATSAKIEVFNSEQMNIESLLASQQYTIPDIAADFEALYICNHNGMGGLVDINDDLDEYHVSSDNNLICCTPNSINGPSTICLGDRSSVFSVDVSEEVSDFSWNITPSYGVNYSENYSSLIINSFKLPGTYTIDYTWTCGCETKTLTKEIEVISTNMFNPEFGLTGFSFNNLTLEAGSFYTSNSVLDIPGQGGCIWDVSEISGANGTVVSGSTVSWLNNFESTSTTFTAPGYDFQTGKFYRLTRTVWMDPCLQPISYSIEFYFLNIPGKNVGGYELVILDETEDVNHVGVKNGLDSKNKISLFPNPTANNDLNIQCNLTGDKTINIYNVQGALVKTAKMNNNNMILDVNELSNSVYIVKIVSGSGEAVISTFVKSN